MEGVGGAKETVIKSGLCVVKRSFTANEPGEFTWDEPPPAVYGTFLVESGGVVAIRSTLRKVVNPEETAFPTGNLRTYVAGVAVKINMIPEGDQAGAVVAGRVWTMPDVKSRSLMHEGRG